MLLFYFRAYELNLVEQDENFFVLALIENIACFLDLRQCRIRVGAGKGVGDLCQDGKRAQDDQQQKERQTFHTYSIMQGGRFFKVLESESTESRFLRRR